ncbi:hypothetical protein GUJ93_ZPchr0011g27293 [Zizania palustris]|uniref:Uncharacterized protein n=1 Tax=Zizania palustris TaxID=103762 RepID=A0A8J6BMP7_ZIZPA|nr:hypothetical protein GUJ93_ZPchr0011g27293 [Zizania palustris]
MNTTQGNPDVNDEAGKHIKGEAISNPNFSKSTSSSSSSLQFLAQVLTAKEDAHSLPVVSSSSGGRTVQQGALEASSAGLKARQISIVYKRRRGLKLSGFVERKESGAVEEASESLATPISSVGLRRSARIQNMLQGFGKPETSHQIAEESMHVNFIPLAVSKGKEIMLPPLPSLQDFINCSKRGLVIAPMTDEQVQHTATRICGVDAELVKEGKLPVNTSSALAITETVYDADMVSKET